MAALVSSAFCSPLQALIVERGLLAGVLLVLVHFFCTDGLTAIGIDRRSIGDGLQKGCLWSFVTGLFVLVAALGFSLIDISLVSLIKVDLPPSTSKVYLFLGAGGLVGPLAEEIFFRGVVFGYLRRWGWFVAIVASAALFALAHSLAAGVFPWPQLLGGILFAAAYEIEKNLMVPITLHVSGNTAIYLLSLLSWC